MKSIVLPFIGIFFFSNVNSQDILYRLKNDSLYCKVQEVGINSIKYKKFENLFGPNYVIDKKEVFKIKYENGVEEYFEGKKEYVFIENKELSQYKVSTSRPKRAIWDYKFDVSKVKAAKTVYYCGLDFSNLILVNPAKVNQEESLNQYFPKWIDRFEVEIPPKNYIRRWLKKDIFKINNVDVQNRYKLNKHDWIKFEKNEIPIEQVLSIIKEYPLISTQENSVAFSIIVESFDKKKEKVTSICVFFDPKTREVLWASKVRGDADGIGFSTHWSMGIVESLKHYIDIIYRKGLKASI